MITRLPVEETLGFLERHLPSPPSRVLEVGCGAGEVATALAARGYEVTALDAALGAPPTEPASTNDSLPIHWIEADFLFYEEEATYDAVLFTRSLHHMTPPAKALNRAAALLRPGGRFLAEEFAFDRVNIQTARWYYDLEAVLASAGLIPPSDPALREIRNPLGRWRQEHASDPPLQSGHSMLAAARERFDLGPAEEAPYLYRSFADRMEWGERSDRVAREIFEIESRMIRERDLAAAGLRLAGTLLG
jgi:SAM-dependent methyltransferase